MPSLASRVLPALISLRGVKKTFATAEATRAKARELMLRPAAFAPPPRLERWAELTARRVDGWPVYEVAPRSGTVRRQAIYLHGGAYIEEITPAHWQLVARMAAATGTRFTVPVYPLAPLGTAEPVVATVTALAARLLDEAGADATFLMGDSAGGGMALAVALQLRDRGLPAPAGTVLISPWLDTTLSDPLVARTDPRDPWLAPDGLRAAGDLYRDGLSAKDPRVSPLFGDLTGLGPVTMFCGTRDILLADARNLTERATSAGVTVDYHEAPEMLHVYPLLPGAEGGRARSVIKEVLCR